MQPLMLQLACTILGGSGPVLVLLHANGFHSRAYQALANHLKDSYTCIGIDLPGHGNSQHCLPEPFTLEAMITAMVEALRKLRITPCYVFGHSWGGALAVLAEAQHPGLFKAMYCFEPVITVAGGPGSGGSTSRATGAPSATSHATGAAPQQPHQTSSQQQHTQANQSTQALSTPQSHTGTHNSNHNITQQHSHTHNTSSPSPSSSSSHPQQQWTNPLARLAAKRRSSFPSKQAALSSLASKPPFSALHPDCLADYIQHGLQQELRSSPSPSYELTAKPAVEAAVFEAFFPLPVPEYTRVRCPVRVASGADVPGMHQVLCKAAEAVAAALPCGERVTFAGLQHLGPMEDPALVAADVRGFFGRVEGLGVSGAPTGVIMSKL